MVPLVRGVRPMLLSIAFAVQIVAGTAEQESARLSPWLEIALRQARAGERQLVWIYFRDKGTATRPRAAAAPISRHASARRAARGAMTAATLQEDLPLDQRYVEQVSRGVSRLRHQSRWLNAVSAEATAAQIQAVSALPVVERIDLVKRYRRVRDEPIEWLDPTAASPRRSAPSTAREPTIDYGSSVEQLAQIRVTELHDRGLTGDGAIVAVFDGGFPNLTHETFARMHIVAEHDFVTGADNVRSSNFTSHGTNTLSVVGGMREGQLIGPAFGASFILAVTEDARSETPVEEDNWVAAAEWVEAMGADVISSSLGYLGFDRPYTSYTDRDLDGETAISTKAANMAAARGVVVVNSAGNGGFSPVRNTLGAPADGKKVLAVGAVDRDGVRAVFSSVGPTADDRVKPDVVALGVRTKVATSAGPATYGLASGTSFSCPLTAGVVALLLQAHPTYTVDQVLFALRSTASQHEAPDNLLGWGIVDGVAAVDVEVPKPKPTSEGAFVIGRLGGACVPLWQSCGNKKRAGRRRGLASWR